MHAFTRWCSFTGRNIGVPKVTNIRYERVIGNSAPSCLLFFKDIKHGFSTRPLTRQPRLKSFVTSWNLFIYCKLDTGKCFLRTCRAHHLAKLSAKHVEDADASSHQQDEVQHGGIAQQLKWQLIGGWQSIGGNGAIGQ